MYIDITLPCLWNEIKTYCSPGCYKTLLCFRGQKSAYMQILVSALVSLYPPVIIPVDITEVLNSAGQTTHPVQPFNALSLVVSGLSALLHTRSSCTQIHSPPGTLSLHTIPPLLSVFLCACALASFNTTLHAYLLSSLPPCLYLFHALCLSLITLRWED